MFPPCNGSLLLQKNIELKIFESVYVTSYRNKLRRDFKPWYGNRQEIFIALVPHVGLESILSTLSTVYIFCMLLKANKNEI